MHSCTESISLNKFLAHAGICSRRRAVALIMSGVVQVNKVVVQEPAVRVCGDDIVTYNGKVIKPEVPLYLILNKPRHVVTTCSDDQGRQTVLHCVPHTLRARIFPVGRLDTETTGLLLLTNDGDLAQRLAHPRFGVRKVYTAQLDRPLLSHDVAAIKRGIRVDGRVIKVDEIIIHHADPGMVRVTLHTGQNRIIKRIFEILSYKVKRLDRYEYAGLTTKGLALGAWRNLTVAELKMLIKKTTRGDHRMKQEA
jgi:23S rRNA pseudouridine2605 synthase